MTIEEKIEYAIEKKIVTFFKEGLFYKCYNEDAMVFIKKVLQPHRGDILVDMLNCIIFNPVGMMLWYQQTIKKTPPLRGLHTMHIILFYQNNIALRFIMLIDKLNCQNIIARRLSKCK